MKLPTIPKREKEICLHLLSLFNIEGKPASEVITGGQLVIFWLLIFRPSKRVQIISCTQYGKSLTVALACIIISCIQDEVVAVLAPTKEKAKEIVRYYIQHIGDNILFRAQLEKDTRLERLRQEESKERIILRNGGGIFVVSTNESDSKKKVEAAMGKGSRITILDEGGLISDETEATVYRMIAGKGSKAFYCKIGNPFYLNHFEKSWKDDRYTKVFIDYELALKEGRYTEDFIEEARLKPLFDVLYECKFPDRDEIDAMGYRYLFSEELLEAAYIDSPEFEEGKKRLGADIGRGGDESSFVVRFDDWAQVESENKSRDTMTQVNEIERISGDDICIDDIGVGSGVTDRCLEKGLNVRGVRVGESATNPDRYANIRAENAFLLREWLVRGGKLVRHPNWAQMLEIKYKENSSGKIQLEPKEQMKARGFKSPNTFDALCLTFTEMPNPSIDFI